MANFGLSYKATCNIEGGYTLDPHETFMRVDRYYFPQWCGWPVIDNMKSRSNFPNCLNSNTELLLMVEDFFKVTFWNPMAGDMINSQPIADKLYDACVNMGVETAIKLMQEAVGAESDGVMGPKTLAAINLPPESDVLEGFKNRRIIHYKSIVALNPKDEKYLEEWLSRC